MRQTLVQCVVVILATFLGGCSFARTPLMYAIGNAEIPVIPGGKAQTTEVMPLIWGPSPHVEREIDSPRNATDTILWYQEQLAQRGWLPAGRGNEQGEWARWTSIGNTLEGSPIYEAKRTTGQKGLSNLEKLTLIVITRPDGRVTLQIVLYGEYAWDAPSRVVFYLASSSSTLSRVGWEYFGSSPEATLWAVAGIPYFVPMVIFVCFL